MNPAWNDGLHGSIGRDVSLAMPVRRTSLSSADAPQLLSARPEYGYSNGLQGTVGRDDLLAIPVRLQSSTSILSCSSSDEENIINLIQCSRSKTGKIKKRVRFAPKQSNPTTTIMSLDDYTTKEHESCWYSRQELDAMHHRHATRWNAGATLDHVYDRKMWSKISSHAEREVETQQASRIP